MSGRTSLTVLKNAALAATLALLTSGCVHDYMQRSDRISYSAGDAVKANLERETIDPSKDSMNNLSGLGRNGYVIPAPEDDSATQGSTPAAVPVQN